MKNETRELIDEISSLIRIDTCNEIASQVGDILLSNNLHVVEVEYIMAMIKRLIDVSVVETSE